MTGLSSAVLEYVVLALVVLAPIVSMLVTKTGNKLLGMVSFGLQFLKTEAMKERDRARARELAEAEAKELAAEEKSES